MFKLILFLPIFTWAQSEFIVWNVGQGQWVTEVQTDFCIHYDMGGEYDITPRALAACGRKKNIIYLSHWDWDHISFVRSFSLKALHACLAYRPAGEAAAWKQKQLEHLPLCPPEKLPTRNATRIHSGRASKKSNNSSSVLYSRDFRILLPGDSPQGEERKWARNVSAQTRGLVLGHHGSRTSTSSYLLENLSSLRWSIASARQARYGHPHPKIVARLRHEKIPLIRTEDWGHLHFLKSASEIDPRSDLRAVPEGPAPKKKNYWR